MNKETNLVQASDFCLQKNIPFNSEEYNFYRLRQTRQRFKHYQNSVNQCFETARPDDFTSGINLLSDRDPRPPADKVTQDYTDGQLYIPNVQVYAKKGRNTSQNIKTEQVRRPSLLFTAAAAMNNVTSKTEKKKKE